MVKIKIYFTEEDIKNQTNIIELEEEEIVLIGEYFEGEGKNYILTGSIIVEGETYHDFQTELELTSEPEEMTAKSIAETEWDWFDYLFL